LDEQTINDDINLILTNAAALNGNFFLKKKNLKKTENYYSFQFKNILQILIINIFLLLLL